MLRAARSALLGTRRQCSLSTMSSPPAPRWRDGSDAQRRAGVAALNTFLLQSKTRLQAALESTTPVHVMIGNEAADADSIVSSLVYAFYRDHVRTTDSPTVFLPVMSIPRDELALRCDVTALFQSLDIDTASLLFVDEFPWRHSSFQQSNSRLRITLLDHNALNTKRIAAKLTGDQLGEIVEILDHHMDVGSHPNASHREVAFADGQALVASCCTLVAEKLLASSDVDSHVHSISATLLLAVIALDSVNFDPSAKKVTARDVEAAERLDMHAFSSGGDLFQWLQAEKFNVAHWHSFTIANCLQCDYKEFQLPDASGRQYGVSAILIPLATFTEKAASAADFTASLQSYCDVNQLAFLVVMSMTVGADGTRRRELLFYESTAGQPYTTTCVEFFHQNGSLELAPLPLSLAEGPSIVAFHQRNVGASRKQVVPLIQQALAPAQVKL